MLEDILAFAALPLAAAVVFTGIHTWFGLQVLRRNVVFADLALAQVSALGATVAVVAGHAVQSAAGYAYTLIFTAVGALLLTADQLVKFIILYSIIGAIHWLLRRPLLAAAADHMDASTDTGKFAVWDLVFYLSFGVVVTSSVATAGVL